MRTAAYASLHLSGKRYFVEVKDEIELAHVAKVTIEDFDEMVDHLKRDELVIILVNSNHKVKARIADMS